MTLLLITNKPIGVDSQMTDPFNSTLILLEPEQVRAGSRQDRDAAAAAEQIGGATDLRCVRRRTQARQCHRRVAGNVALVAHQVFRVGRLVVDRGTRCAPALGARARCGTPGRRRSRCAPGQASTAYARDSPPRGGCRRGLVEYVAELPSLLLVFEIEAPTGPRRGGQRLVPAKRSEDRAQQAAVPPAAPLFAKAPLDLVPAAQRSGPRRAICRHHTDRAIPAGPRRNRRLPARILRRTACPSPICGYSPDMGQATLSASRSFVLIEDPGLGERMAPQRWSLAIEDCVAHAIEVPAGDWSPAARSPRCDSRTRCSPS